MGFWLYQVGGCKGLHCRACRSVDLWAHRLRQPDRQTERQTDINGLVDRKTASEFDS